MGEAPPENMSHISYNDENWHSYTLPIADQKNILNYMAHLLIFAEISIFSPEITKFCYTKKYGYRSHFDT